MLSRRFIALGAIIFLIAPVSYSQEPKPADSAEKPSASPVKPRATPTPTEPPITFNSVHVDGPYIALTFDDGPNATLTPKLLDLLAARHLKATFFVVGQNAADHPDILKRAVREGHEIGNHSWSHPNLAKMSDEAVRRTRSWLRLENGRRYCGRPTDRSRRAKRNGFTRSSVIGSLFGTSIRSIGNDRDRAS